jgi:hypothetical protein
LNHFGILEDKWMPFCIDSSLPARRACFSKNDNMIYESSPSSLVQGNTYHELGQWAMFSFQDFACVDLEWDCGGVSPWMATSLNCALLEGWANLFGLVTRSHGANRGFATPKLACLLVLRPAS